MGLVSWLGAGLLALLLARLTPRAGSGADGVLAALGSLAGGLAATALDFGGVAVFDLRSFLVAFLAAVLALLLRRLLTP